MDYEIEIERAATRRMRRLDKPVARKLLDTIGALADDPRPHGTKALTGRWSGHYRLRVSAPGGEYRIVYRVNDDAFLVTVIDAGPREGTYG